MSISDIRSGVEAFEAAGYAMPEKLHTSLDTAGELTDFAHSGLPRPTNAQYADAVMNGSVEQLQDLLVMAGIARSVDQQTRHEVANQAEAVITGPMRRVYNDAVAELWPILVKDFNAAATKFMTYASATDIGAPPEELVGKPQKEQRAWLESTNEAAKLDSLAALIERAAIVLGYPVKTMRFNKFGVPRTLNDHVASAGLYIVPNSASNKTVFEAWTSPLHRCGRWGALLNAGADIEAPADIADAYIVTTPRADETRYVRGDGPLGGQKAVVETFDHEVRRWKEDE